MPAKEFDAFTRLDASDVNAYLANKSISNAFINGAFDIWQRGNSFTGTGPIADRWRSIHSGTGTTTFSRADVSTDSSVVGKYALQITKSSGSTTGDYFLQRIEGVKSVTGQLTYSLYAKANAATDITVYARQYFGTGGSPSAIVDVLFGTISVPSGSTFEKYSLTETLLSLAGKTVGTDGNDYVEFFAIISNSANATLTVTNIQVEPGSVANDFRRNADSLQGELAACQRYYFKLSSPGSFTSLGFGQCTSATEASIGIPFPVEMRTNPGSLEQTGVAGNYGVSSAGGGGNSLSLVPAFAGATRYNATVSCTTGSVLVAGNITRMFDANTPGAFLAWNVEL